MMYQVDCLFPLKLKKISFYFGLCRQILLPNTLGVSAGGFFTFDMFELLILILGVHCCIVLVVLEDILFKIVTAMTKIVINSFVTMIPIT